MYFTKEDILKIQQALSQLGVKDSELQETSLPKWNDYITIVQDGKNKKVSVQKFLNQFVNESFINLTAKYDTAYVSIKEAIKDIPIAQRKKGLLISFIDINKEWKLYQFKGELSQFNNYTLWDDVFNLEKYVINSIIPDEEDITITDKDSNGNSKLKFKDKKYDPSTFSGMGYKILRKNIVRRVNDNGTIDYINYLSPNEFSDSNTIYEIRYDFNLNGDIVDLLDNCVLLFNGGSIDNGTITCNNTYILQANESFKDNLFIKGTVKNNIIESNWWYMPKEDCYYQVKNIIELSNKSEKPARFKKDNYLLLNHSEDSIIVQQSIDFGDSTVTLNTNGYENFNFDINQQEVQAINQNDYAQISLAINNKNLNAEVFKKYKNCLLLVDSDEIEIVRSGNNEIFKKHEILYVDINGYLQNVPFNESINISKGTYIRCDKQQYIKNLKLLIEDTYDKEQVSYYRRLGFKVHNCSNLTVQNIIIEDPNITKYRIEIFGGSTAYNLTFKDCYLTNTKDNKDYIVGDISAYVFDLRDIVKLNFNNVQVSNLTSKNVWGATGTNYIVDWTIENSSLNRIDTHYRLNNLYVNNTVVGVQPISYTGFGKIILTNTKFYNNVILQPRVDYGSFFDGDIIIENCEVVNYVQDGSIYCIVAAMQNGNHSTTNLSHYKHIGANNLYVRNLKCEYPTVDYRYFHSVRFETSTNSTEYLKRIHPNIYIDNVNNVHPKLYLQKYQAQMFEKTDVLFRINNCIFNKQASILGLTNFLQFTDLETELPVYRQQADECYNLFVDINNCKNVIADIFDNNAVLNISNSTIQYQANKLSYGNYVFSCEDNSINVFDSIIIADPYNYVPYYIIGQGYYNNCIFSSVDIEDLTLIDNLKARTHITQYTNNKYYYNTPNNVRLYSCRIDKKLAEYLEIPEDSILYDPLNVKEVYVEKEEPQPIIQDNNPLKMKYYNTKEDETVEIDVAKCIEEGYYRFRLNAAIGNFNLKLTNDIKSDTVLDIWILGSYSKKSNVSFINNNNEIITVQKLGNNLALLPEWNEYKIFINKSSETGEFTLAISQRQFASPSNASFQPLAGYNMIKPVYNAPIWWTGDKWIYATGQLAEYPLNGTQGNRPLLEGKENVDGFQYYNSTLKQPCWWNGEKWITFDIKNADIITKGTTQQRPTLTTDDEGFQYYDTTLHKPIWWNGTQWIDGTNTPV